MTEKLKPCPFCGGEAVLDDDFFYTDEPAYIISCNKCYSSSDVYDTEHEAIEAWNRRAGE